MARRARLETAKLAEHHAHGLYNQVQASGSPRAVALHGLTGAQLEQAKKRLPKHIHVFADGGFGYSGKTMNIGLKWLMICAYAALDERGTALAQSRGVAPLAPAFTHAHARVTGGGSSGGASVDVRRRRRRLTTTAAAPRSAAVAISCGVRVPHTRGLLPVRVSRAPQQQRPI